MSKRFVYLLCMALACAVFVAACGEDEEGGGGGGTDTESGATEGAKAIDPASMEGASGEITYCLGKDTSGDKTAALKRFNEQNPDIKAEMLEFSTSADEQRTQFVQRQEAKSGECDVFYADVIWTAEFASQKWIFDMTPYVEEKKSSLIEATLDSATYDGKIWAMPQQTDAAFIYYRDDQVDEVPATWQELYEAAGQNDGIVYQGAPYEGLTCNFLEIAYAAGGEILSEDGTEAVIDSPENVEALKFMADGVKDGTAANGVTTYMEEESRRYFESGKATFMRNWPYAYSLGQKKGTAVSGKFKVAPFPEFEGARQGGHPRRSQQRDLRAHREPRRRPQARRLPDERRGAADHVPRLLAGTRGRRRVRQPGGPEEVRLRHAAQGVRRPGALAPGVAGLSADLAGDLQERQRGPGRSCLPRGGAEDRPDRDAAGAGDVLDRPWKRLQ